MGNRRIFIALIGVLLMVALYSLYMYMLSPVQDKNSNLRREIDSIESDIASAREKISVLQSKTNQFSERELLVKLPKNEDVPNILEMIQQSELLTGSSVIGAKFNNYDVSIGDSDYNKQEEEEKPPIDEDGELNTEEKEETLQSEFANENIMQNLQLVTAEVEVLHKNYKEFYDYLMELEKNERLLDVERIEFKAPGEEQLNREELDKINEQENKYLLEPSESVVQFTTFYMK